ncbi:MAG: hypothetical protein U9O87_04345 [Verrucomicrobiota bacterium]|nr:hypothetical protein [Verrucomicrobiota bacterium]
MKQARKVLMVLLVCAGFLISAAEREIDYAAEDAAFKTIKELTKRKVDVKKIAFLGIAGAKEMNFVFRGGLLRVPGEYEFITRDEAERRMSEMETDAFSGSELELALMGQESTIDLDTFLSLEKTKKQGVEAYLYGKVLEATVVDGSGIFRVTLTLQDLRSQKILWSGNIVGEHKIMKLENISKGLLFAAENLGQNALKDLQEKISQIPDGNVFVLPLIGEKADQLTDTILSEIVAVGNTKLAFFSSPSNPQNKRVAHSIALDLAGAGSGTLPDMREIKRMMKQVEQVFDIGTESGASGVTTKISKENLYMTGVVKNLEQKDNKAKDQKEYSITVAFSLRNFKNNQLLWGKTVTGQFIDTAERTPDYKVKKAIKDNKTILMIAGGVVAALIALVLAIFILKKMTQIR